MLRCRKNQASLTPLERSRFVAALIALKAAGTYDQYVQDHVNFMAGAHRGPAFFPWHREFLRRLELDLQAIDSTVTLPYWDWTVDNSPSSSIWNADFMGGNGQPSDGKVVTGPFAEATGDWPLNVETGGSFGYLRRRFGLSAPSLPSAASLSTALTTTPYDAAPWNDGWSTGGFRNRAEGWYSGPQLHNLVHVWIGGSMAPASSPNDPVFFLHHCFVDKIWADWQVANPGMGYLPTTPIAGKPLHSLHEAMEPWASAGDTVTPASVLDHHALGYAYDTEGVCALKLKVLDDPITLKFSDDHKFKVFDDVASLKVLDDPITLKFLDDGGTLPAIDIRKAPALDKHVGFDAGFPGIPRQPGDPFQRRGGEVGRGAAPFVLSTPHHSTAWQQSGSGAQIDDQQLTQAIAQYEATIAEINAAHEQRGLGESEMLRARQIYTEYETLVAELNRRQQGG